MDKKPDVFNNTKEMSMADKIKEANESGELINQQFIKENNIQNIEKSEGEKRADELMKKNTQDNLDRQIKAFEAYQERIKNKDKKSDVIVPPKEEFISEPVDDSIKTPNLNSFNLEKQEDVPFDIITLPSKGKLYKNKKSTMKVAYLNALDESIITNPNILSNGKFLEILINRKMLDTDLTYHDLHIGDRNAIMVWLRSTAYGPMYKINVSNPTKPNFEQFETEIDLSSLKIIELGAEPDSNGYFDYTLPSSGSKIKFKLLNIRELEEIDLYTQNLDKEDKFNDSNIYEVSKHIVEFDGNTDSDFIKKSVSKMRLGDLIRFRKYVDEISSGLDMNVSVRTPGGESITTFLPLNITFFWPDF